MRPCVRPCVRVTICTTTSCGLKGSKFHRIANGKIELPQVSLSEGQLVNLLSTSGCRGHHLPEHTSTYDHGGAVAATFDCNS